MGPLKYIYTRYFAKIQKTMFHILTIGFTETVEKLRIRFVLMENHKDGSTSGKGLLIVVGYIWLYTNVFVSDQYFRYYRRRNEGESRGRDPLRSTV